MAPQYLTINIGAYTRVVHQIELIIPEIMKQMRLLYNYDYYQLNTKQFIDI